MALPFTSLDHADPESVVWTEANEAARQLLANPNRWHNAAAVLIGPAGSGKSHMIRAFASEYAVVPIRATSIYPGYSAGVLVVDQLEDLTYDDNGDQSGKACQETLFHLLNRAMVGELKVLMTSAYPIKDLALGLPDLTSRLSAASSAVILPPDQQMLMQLLAKRFSDAQIDVKFAVIEYLVDRIDRTYAEANRVVEVVNAMALAERRAVTIPLVKAALQL